MIDKKFKSSQRGLKDPVDVILRQHGIHPSKERGQNFLIDQNALSKIVKAAELDKNDNVLEVGPGLGVLTEELVKKAGQVISVELDKKLIFYLKQKFKRINNLDIIDSDILKIKNAEINKNFESKKYKVVANLPYNITKPVLRKFLDYEPKPELIAVLVQKEVAEKIAAQNKKHSILSLSVLFYGQPEIVDYVPSKSFYPAPKVDSAILKIKIRPGLPPEAKQVLSNQEIKNFNQKRFWQIIKFGFSSPRKQLQNNLSAGLKISNQDIKNILEKCDLTEKIRAEDLSLENWFKIYQQVIDFT